jgi:hypothetical protein
MTDEQIVKALECCIQIDVYSCYRCPLYERGQGCLGGDIRVVALDLIKRQQAEIERLKFPYKMQVEVSREIENEIKSEAVREFAEKILNLFPSDKNHTTISRFAVKQITKELAEKEGGKG